MRKTGHTIVYSFENNTVIKRFMIIMIALVTILFCTFALSTMATAKHTKAASRHTQITYESVRINGGDSLWSIAQEYRGVESTSDFVEELKTINNLSSDHIQSGSYLLVPVTSVL